MRCAQCGSPLSPARNYCLQCGAVVTESFKPSKGSQDVRSQQQNIFPGQGRPLTPSLGGIPVGIETSQQGRGASNSRDVQGMIPGQQMAIPASQQLVYSPYNNTPEQYPEPAPQATSSGNPKASAPLQESLPQAPRTPKRQASRSSSRLGFMVSGLCVITSMLILIFVYFMALSLPPLNAQSSTDAAEPSGTPTSSALVTSLTPQPASPTPTFPGQQYIDNVQLASVVDTVKAQPTRLATTFKTNQRMYVTFDIHPGGRSGTVCLLWFLNASQFNHFALSVGPIPQAAYSFTNMPPVAGSGYVELYWGHIPSCTDPNKVLAQRVSFAVSS